MEPEQQELLYNQKDICEIYMNLSREKTAEALTEKYIILTEAFKGSSSEYLRIYLQCLNHAFYNCILMTANFGENRLSFKSAGCIKKNMTCDEFVSCALQILDSYAPYMDNSRVNKYIRKACEFIDEHLEEEITLEKVSASVFIDRCYLSHLFKMCLGQNFSEYLISRRITRAKMLLCNSDLPMDIISQKSGFSSASYFSTTFKKTVGVSPTVYRANSKMRHM